MIKASDLILKQEERKNIKYKTFNKIYKLVEKKIVLASSTDFYYIWYEIPEFLIGYPLYNYKECIRCVKGRLEENDFLVEEYEPNILLISWFPK